LVYSDFNCEHLEESFEPFVPEVAFTGLSWRLKETLDSSWTEAVPSAASIMEHSASGCIPVELCQWVEISHKITGSSE